MADAVISALVDHFVSLSLQKIEEEVRLVKNAKKDVEQLKKSLRLIQALLEDAGKKQLESASVRQWLSDLEETSYDTDDVLDEWNAAILKAEIEKEAAAGSGHGAASDHHVVVQQKVCFPMPSCFCFKEKVKEVISLRDFAKRIKELTEELDRIKKEGNELGIVARAIEPSHCQSAAASSLSKPRITVSLVDEAKVHGRDQEKALLVSKLVCESSSDHKGNGFEIIPIVGMGGLGKTTLAQIAYNDDSVKAHFDKRIWVCVSDPFDLIKIAKAIVEGLGGNPQNYAELEASMKFISESIRGKKFLLILDDVWSKDKETWEQLSQPLKFGGPGSRILVTTRNMEVAMMMGVSTHMIGSLENLTDEQCWSIIKQLAFVEGDSSEFITQLEAVGKKISSKCKGLPLIAKILGSLMCFRKSKAQWEGILHNQLWESRAVDEIFAPFLLSYYDLSSSEKCCFSYCSLFPKDCVIERDMLIEMWMSQGYFSDSSEGQDCFESLARRSFFQEFVINEYNGNTDTCKMHDIVHDFAQYLTKDKCVAMEGSAIGEKIESLDDKARHLTLLVDAPSQLSPTLRSKHEKKTDIGNKLRTLLVAPSGTNIEDCEPEFLNLKCLRTWTTLNSSMHLRPRDDVPDVKFPQNLSMLIHLRYLDISYRFHLTELPESVCDLYNLQTLRLIACVALQSLPNGIGKLVNLRHLYVDQCQSLMGFPKGLEKLTRLQKLDALVIPKNKESCFHVDNLRKLRRLHFQGSLSINRGANFGNASEAEKVNLIDMEDIDTLDLVFAERLPRVWQEANEDGDSILEALKPHPNLKNLRIRYYNGITMSPSWITTLTSLRDVCIWECGFCEILPPLGKLPSLESLEIGPMESVKKVGLEFLGITRRNDENDSTEITNNMMLQSSFVSFPKLKILSFFYLTEWKEWEGINVATNPSLKVMPSLRSLTISFCSLEALPDFIQMIPVQDLSIEYCHILEGTGIEWLKNSNIKNVQLSDGYVKKDGIWIQRYSKKK